MAAVIDAVVDGNSHVLDMIFANILSLRTFVSFCSFFLMKSQLSIRLY